MATITDKPPAPEDEKKRKRNAALERTATLVTAAIASATAAQGMYVFFRESLQMPTPLLLMCFSFIELMVITSAMRARRSQIDTGSAGIDGVAMWVLTITSGILATTHAAGAGEHLLRLLAPVIAAWGWERSMKLERRQLTGEDGGLNWRWSPERLLVRWGIVDPTNRTTAEVAVERRLIDLARAADHVRLAQTTGRSARHERKMMQRLHRAIDKATEDGVALGDPEIRERLRQHLDGRFGAYAMPKYQPTPFWEAPVIPTDPAPGGGPGGGLDIDAELARLITTPEHDVSAHPEVSGAHAHLSAHILGAPGETVGAHAHQAMRTDGAQMPIAEDDGASWSNEDAALPGAGAHQVRTSARPVRMDAQSQPAQDAHPDSEDAHEAVGSQEGVPVEVVSTTRVAEGDAHSERTAGPGAHEVRATAEALIRRGVTTKPLDEVAQVLELAKAGTAPSTVARNTGIHYKTVTRILAGAEELRQPRLAAAGGRVIELDRRTNR